MSGLDETQRYNWNQFPVVLLSLSNKHISTCLNSGKLWETEGSHTDLPVHLTILLITSERRRRLIFPLTSSLCSQLGGFDIFREMWRQLKGFQITVTSLRSQLADGSLELTTRSSSFWGFYCVKRSEVVSPSVSSWHVNICVSQCRSDRLPHMCHRVRVLLGPVLPVLPVHRPPGPVSVCWELVSYRCDSCDSSLSMMWFPLYGSQISDFVFWAAVLYKVAGQQRQYKSFKDTENKDKHLWTWKLFLIHGNSCLIK